MPRYARIIDRGECYSTSNLIVNGVRAHKSEWAKYNFYPQNGMVGEILIVNGCTVLKILDGVFVQMSSRGIQEITQQEYEKEKVNNVCTGMDERQKRINNQLDSYLEELSIFGGGKKFQEMSAMDEDNREIAIYCFSAKKALALQHDQLVPRIASLAQTLRMQHISNLSFDQVIDRLTDFVTADMRMETYNPYDKESLSWFTGLWVKAYEEALNGIGFHSFDDVFTRVYKTYMSRQ